MRDLSAYQKERILFAARILGVMGASRGEHPCVTFCTAEDDFETRIHACFCTRGQVTIYRLGSGDVRPEE